MSCSATWLVSGRRVALVALALVIGGCSPTNPSYIANVPFSSTDVVTGTGTEALVGKVLAVDYAGYLYNASRPENKGTLFDTSLNTDVISFPLGAGAVIRGYGSTGRGPIPPNATLVFDVWLLGVFEPDQVPQ